MDAAAPAYYVFPPAPSDPPAPPPPLGEAGGKALGLCAAAAAGFPVPPGLVLTVAFFRPWLEEVRGSGAWRNCVEKQKGGEGEVTKEDCDAIKKHCRELLSLSDAQTGRLEAAVREAFGPGADLGDNLGIVAVRSSSPEEDLAGASFAGGYDTTLGVTSNTLESAIVESFASLFDHRVHLYKVRKGVDVADPRIAVVVQRQVDSRVSGVAFSINPGNNCYDEVAVSANFGLGESVVGGTVTPDTYVVDRFDPAAPRIAERKVAKKTSSVWLGSDDGESEGGTHQRDHCSGSSSAPALSDKRILEVAALAGRVEELLEAPADVEWAYDEDGKLHLLQARPVTAYVPLFPEMTTGRGEERKLYVDVMVMTQGFSEPLSTLGLDLWRTMVARIKPMMSTEGEDGLVWNLHGRQYMNVSNMLMMTGGNAMVNKAFRTYEKAMDRAFDSIDIGDYTPSEVPEGAKGIMWKQLKQLGTMLPSVFSGLYKGGESMKEYIDGSNAIIDGCYDDECSKEELFREAFERLIDKYEAIMPMMGGISAGLVSRAVLHNWVFSKCPEANDYLINMTMDLKGNPTSEMGHFMVRLASYPELQETSTGEEFARKLEGRSYSKDVAEDCDAYLKKFGCRGIREIDVATPRTYEELAGLFSALKAIDVENNQIVNVRERREKAYQELLKMARERGQEERFVHHAGVIQSLMGYREHPKYMLVVMIARMRRHALNIAREFVARGRLEDADQIFALTIEQVTNAQEDADMELLPLVEANLDPVRKVAHVKTWPTLIDSRGRIIRGVRGEDADVEEGTLLGDPISPGTVAGRAKVLLSPYGKPVCSGEILVARFTEPSWTPLFINAAGVVMEVGGPMQHGAIIAREYGIPCVSGLDKATEVINDGDLLEVDGSSGIVRVIESAGDNEVLNGKED